jgi:hypothetical protein
MTGQLDALVAAGSSPNISIRVMPLATALHRAAVAGSFAIMDFPTVGARAAEPSTVYSESLTGALYLDKAAEVRTFADAWRGGRSPSPHDRIDPHGGDTWRKCSIR